MVAETVIEYRRPWLAAYQLAAIFHHKRYGLIEASTKSGKTHGCIIWLFEQAAAGEDGQNFWWIAPVFPQAHIAFRRLRRALWKAIPGYFKANKTDMTITLANGATIWFKSGENPDNLYGEDVYAAVIDEASRCREESWHAVRSTLTATRGPIRIIGNVKGRKNWAYRLARRAEAGEADMHFAKITAHDAVKAGILKAEEIADAKATLPEAIFQELYEAEPSDDGGNPFGLASVRQCIRPLSELPAAHFGCDLAKSLDWTVTIGLDRAGATATFERFQLPWHATTLRVRSLAAGRPVLVDATGVGDPILEELQLGGGYYEGYKFSSNSKQQLMEGLAVAIQQQEVFFPEGPIVDELEEFEYEYTRTGVRYSAPEGLHDDCVVALALAVRCRKMGLQAMDVIPMKVKQQWGEPKPDPRDPFSPPPQRRTEASTARAGAAVGGIRR